MRYAADHFDRSRRRCLRLTVFEATSSHPTRPRDTVKRQSRLRPQISNSHTTRASLFDLLYKTSNSFVPNNITLRIPLDNATPCRTISEREMAIQVRRRGYEAAFENANCYRHHRLLTMRTEYCGNC